MANRTLLILIIPMSCMIKVQAQELNGDAYDIFISDTLICPGD